MAHVGALVDPQSLIGQKMRVHVNLQNGKLAISNTSGKVMAYCDSATLSDVRFHVSCSMRERVVRMKRRKVHAWGIGTLTAVDDVAGPPADVTPIGYNPFKAATFVRNGEPVLTAGTVVFVNKLGYEVST